MPPRRASYHHGELRRALLDATLRLAAERGAAGVTLREAARLAGVSQTAPYRHFSDKTAMLAAASEEGFAILTEAMRDAARAQSADPHARLVALGAAYVGFAVTHAPHFRLMFGHGSPSRATAHELRARARVSFDLLAATVGEWLHERRHERSETVRTTMFQIWALVHGVATLVVEQQTRPLGVTAAAAAGMARGALEALLTGLSTAMTGGER